MSYWLWWTHCAMEERGSATWQGASWRNVWASDTMARTHVALLELAATILEPLLPEIVFVGGCATALLITDPAAAPARVTYDVDVIAEIVSYPDYVAFSERLRALGLEEDTREGAPVCRWRRGEFTLDVMPLDAAILGFSNRWYPDVLRDADELMLPSGMLLRVISSPLFLATKIEAFNGRGEMDYFASRDLEDIVTVVDGRPSLANEVKRSSDDVRAYVAQAIGALLREQRFLDAPPGYLLPDPANQARLSRLIAEFRELAGQG
jgi:hypothetical protein